MASRCLAVFCYLGGRAAHSRRGPLRGLVVRASKVEAAKREMQQPTLYLRAMATTNGLQTHSLEAGGGKGEGSSVKSDKILHIHSVYLHSSESVHSTMLTLVSLAGRPFPFGLGKA